MSANRRKIVVYTRQYPKPSAPTDGLFTKQMVSELKKIADVTVVCPLPWCPKISFFKRWPDWYASTAIPKKVIEGDLEIYYPKFLLIPFLARFIQPLFQILGTFFLMLRLRKQGRVEAINAHNLYPDGVGAALLSKMLNIPLVLTSLGSDINANESSKVRMSQILWAMNSARGVTAKSQALTEKISKMVDPDVNVSYIPNGINTSMFQATTDELKEQKKKALGLSLEEIYVVFVGRLDEVKGLTYLLDALSILKDKGALNFTTLLIGDGPQNVFLKEKAERLGLLPRVKFEGRVAHDRVGEYLYSADLFCLPSLSEGLPNVALEALACGVPLVGSNVGGVPELVNDDNGLLTEAANAQDLAKKLERALNTQWDSESISSTVSWADWHNSAAQYLNKVELAMDLER